MRAVELFLGGAVIVVLVLAVVALLTDSTGLLEDDGPDREVVEEPDGADGFDGVDESDGADGFDGVDESEGADDPDTEDATPDAPGDADEPDALDPDGAAQGTDQPGAAAPGTDQTPGAAASGGDQTPGAGSAGTDTVPGSQAEGAPGTGDGRRVAVDEPAAGGPEGSTGSPSTLPNTGGGPPAVVGLALLAVAGVVGLVRVRASE